MNHDENSLPLRDADLSPRLPASASKEQGVAAWIDVMDACHEFLMAGLRREVGPEGDVAAAYRSWYARQMEDHDHALERMVEAFNCAESTRGAPSGY